MNKSTMVVSRKKFMQEIEENTLGFAPKSHHKADEGNVEYRNILGDCQNQWANCYQLKLKGNT
ncbi:hypothetical protein DGWBC_1572 [Dehalogenimonas sp. WBC-2]|nr:hypothetical protein DGWBC_1572 [Dehalogenimonas sp. WBC-2]